MDGVTAEVRSDEMQERKGPGSVIEFETLQERRVQKVLAATVRVRNRSNVGYGELFCPTSNAVVVLRGAEGTQRDPVDFNTEVRGQQKKRRKRRKRT